MKNRGSRWGAPAKASHSSQFEKLTESYISSHTL